MGTLVSNHALHNRKASPHSYTEQFYHDDGLEIANDAAIPKQRTHFSFLALHRLS